MASSGANVVYARPIRLVNDRNPPSIGPKQSTLEPKRTKHVTIVIPKSKCMMDIENSEPPPRPPPPRPARVPKQPKNIPPHDRNHQYNVPTTPEPKPLTRTNVTDHDKLWQDIDEEDRIPADVLTPPMKYITPETTEEMWRNFDPLDVIDSTSDRSDSSADTMIMMTTEEEKSNKEKIDSSLKDYKSRKSKPDVQYTNKLKVNIQSKKNLHINFQDTNGFVKRQLPQVPLTNGYPEPDSVSKVVPLHVTTNNDINGSSPESVTSKPNGQYSSPNDSPDDGYGTNSSSGTLSSPFSSSFNSDLENSCNGSFKKVILPNGAIKPNSVRENWAVKRKQRMIEAQDNSVQEQLRELAIIEEEGSGNSLHVKHRLENTQYKNQHGVNVARYRRHSENSGMGTPQSQAGYQPNSQVPNRTGQNHANGQATSHVVNVMQSDLYRENGQLYVISSDNDTSPGPRRAEHHHRALPTSSSTNEISAPHPVPPPYQDVIERRGEPYSGPVSRGENRQPDRTRNTRLLSNGDAERTGDVTVPAVDNTPRLRGGGGDRNHPTQIGSGKIYMSPTGDEGFYSLNRSSRSTSVSSFDPLMIDQVDPTAETSSSPRSPLEVLSGDLLEKWTDMDRNYRNYFGFEEEREKYSRTDSKVNYFQEKKLNNLYGHDNYYRPSTYAEEQHAVQGNIGQGHLGQGHISGHMSARDLRHIGVTETDSVSTRSATMRVAKTSKEGEKSKHKLFQILPNMFRPSSKKPTVESKEAKTKSKTGILKTDTATLQQQQQQPPQIVLPPELEQESEYMNISDIPRYSLAYVLQEEKLARGEYVPLESLQKRPVFASSKDIQKLFSKQNQSFDSLHNPGSQRHSFHAMPLSYRHVIKSVSDEDDMRPRAQSTSATMRSQFKSSVENRMAVISRKNAHVMSQARNIGNVTANSVGNLSLHSNSSNQQAVSGSRTRLDSGSSGGDSKLSTLV